MAKIQIICSSPGMRRNGTTHPASAFYDVGYWTETQIAAFKADPAFTVREVVDGDTGTSEADFDLRVKTEVERLLAEKANQLQLAFDQAVSGKVAERQLGLANAALAAAPQSPASDSAGGSEGGAASETGTKSGKSKS